VNEAAERASGISNAEWLGRHFTDPVPPEARQQVTAQFRHAVESGQPTDFETVFIDGSGTLRGVRAQHLPLRSGDAVVGVLILAFGVHGTPSEPIRFGRPPHLTPRQRQILELLASGLSTSEIAGQLTLSIETVRNHVRNVLKELNAHTRSEALVAARRLGLLAPPPLKPQRPVAPRAPAD
jgi:DNA-binding CsgD family transcriptional regulator